MHYCMHSSLHNTVIMYMYPPAIFSQYCIANSSNDTTQVEKLNKDHTVVHYTVYIEELVNGITDYTVQYN